MKFGRMAALAAGALLVAGSASATILQVPLNNGDTGDVRTWDPSPAPVGAPARPFETIDPVSNFEVNGVDDSAVTTVEVSDSAVSSRTFDNAMRGETDAVRLTGAPLPKPSLWAWMVAGFDGLGATIRRIAASA